MISTLTAVPCILALTSSSSRSQRPPGCTLSCLDGWLFVKKEGEFEVGMTVLSDRPEVPWDILSVNILIGVGRTEKPSLLSPSPLVGAEHLAKLRQLLQHRVVGCEEPLLEVHRVMHAFCLALWLRALHQEAQEAMLSDYGASIGLAGIRLVPSWNASKGAVEGAAEELGRNCVVLQYWHADEGEKGVKDKGKRTSERRTVDGGEIAVHLSQSKEALWVSHRPRYRSNVSDRLLQLLCPSHVRALCPTGRATAVPMSQSSLSTIVFRCVTAHAQVMIHALRACLGSCRQCVRASAAEEGDETSALLLPIGSDVDCTVHGRGALAVDRVNVRVGMDLAKGAFVVSCMPHVGPLAHHHVEDMQQKLNENPLGIRHYLLVAKMQVSVACVPHFYKFSLYSDFFCRCMRCSSHWTGWH